MSQFPHEFLNNLRLRILGNEKVLGNLKSEYRQFGKSSKKLKKINHQTLNKSSTSLDFVN